MSYLFVSRQNRRALALFLSWLLFTAALPAGSFSQSAKPASPLATETSTPSDPPARQAAAAVGNSQASEPDEATQKRLAEAYGKLPLRFEANQGQTDPQVRFLARGAGYGLFLTSTEAVLALNKPAARKEKGARAKTPAELRGAGKIRGAERGSAEAAERAKDAKAEEAGSAVLRMKLEGANPASQAEGIDELPGKSHYFIGNDPQKWRTDVPSYARVMFRDVYPGVDLVYYGKDQQLEYDFMVAPGVDPATIRLAYEGAQSIEMDAQGDLVLHTEGGDVRQHKPVVYQEVDGARREIPSRYVLKDQQRVGFHVDAYDASKPLVIDPVLVYATFLGGFNSEEGLSITVDASGNAYVAGRAGSFNFPVENPTQPYGGNSDAFVAKLNPTGSALIYSTYLGGTQTERAYGVAVDSGGRAYVTGYTYSPDMPLINPVQATITGKDDMFVAKLSPAGSSLIYSTYLGGSSYEVGRGIAADADGNAYMTGFTYSHNLPTVNPLQAAKGGNQAFKSANGGKSWSASDTGLDVAFVNDLVVDPSRPSTLYSATELGVFKSTDSGGSWNASSVGLSNPKASNGDALRLVIDPKRPSTIYVGTYNGVYKSTNGGRFWGPSFFQTLNSVFFIDALAIDPSNPSNLYVSLSGFPLRSTDGGDDWQQLQIRDEDGFQEFVSAFAVDPSNSSIVYAATPGRGVYKSTDGGQHWQLYSAGLPVSLFINNLLIDPANPNILYAPTTSHGIYRSTNGGRNWSAVNAGLPQTGAVYALTLDPAHPSILYAGKSGHGLFKSINSGGSWTPSEPGLTNSIVTGIAVDPTDSSKVYAGTASESDAFIMKLNPAGSSLLYSTYVGGNEQDGGRSIALGAGRSPHVTGLTASTNFPLANPLQASFASPDSASTDAFVTKLDASGSSLAYSTYLGGSGNEEGAGIAVDRQGNAYVAGFAEQIDPALPMSFPTTPGAYQTDFNANSFSDAFVTKINAAGSNLVYSTYLGGRGFDAAQGIAVSASGQAFVTGLTQSSNFPLVGATQGSINDFVDAFVSRLNAAGSSLVFSTYLGGHGNFFVYTDQGNGIAVDSANNAYVVGNTDAQDFPVTPNGFQRFISGTSDAFVAKIGATPQSVRISGKVFRDGVGLGGVTLTLKDKAGAVLQKIVTRSDGSYFFDVQGGRDYTITPSKLGYKFNPEVRIFNGVGSDLTRQNFTATPETFQIFAYTAGSFGDYIPFVRYTLTGTRTDSCASGQQGYCVFSNLPAGGNYTITPSKAEGVFTPQSRTFNNLSENEAAEFQAAFKISGRVTGINGTGVSNVRVQMFGDYNVGATTDSNGNYSFGYVPAGGFYVINPARESVSFLPEYREFFNSNTPLKVNFEAVVSITGRVEQAYTDTGLSDVTVRMTGSRTGTRTTDFDGYFTFFNLPFGGDYTVTPSKAGYSFYPPSRTYPNISVNWMPGRVHFDAIPESGAASGAPD
jgi:photosystem II stability/assembly factor-like uncharacterized protein